MNKLPVKISEKAIAEIKKIISSKKIPGKYSLRMGIKGVGCVGTSYLLGFDLKKDNDDVFEKDGLKILISKRDLMYLIGKNLDFYEGAEARGFTFYDIDKDYDK